LYLIKNSQPRYKCAAGPSENLCMAVSGRVFSSFT
jgi:hypothetical protein